MMHTTAANSSAPIPDAATSTAAFFASASASAASASAPVPYPFQTSSEYAAFLSEVESRLGHRFRRPSLVLALLFHCSLHRYLEFLGAGLLRFYASHIAYSTFAHYDEGYLTRLKDFLHTGLNKQDVMTSAHIGVDLSEAIARLEEAQRRWKPAADGATPQPAPSNANATSDSDSASSPLSAARLQLDRLLRLPSDPLDFEPHAAFASDLLQPILAALYLDGGWPAADAFANRVIRPHMMQLQQLLKHQLPDEDLGTQNYKSALQPLVQRVYGVTPIFDVTRHEAHRFTVRVVIPPVCLSPRSSDGAPIPAALSQIHQAVHLPRSVAIVFQEFSGTKKIAEQKAARYAVEMILQEKKLGRELGAAPTAAHLEEGTGPAESTEDAATLASILSPLHLRSTLHSVAAQLPTFDLDPDLRTSLQSQLVALVQVLITPAALHLATPANVDHAPTPNDGDTSHLQASASHTTDPFELALAELNSPSVAPSAAAPASTSAQWAADDYYLLISTLHSLQCWSSFPPLWPLLTDISLTLPSPTARLLIDAFSRAHTLPLVIQTLRRVRQQQQWRVDRSMLHQLLIASSRASPLWGWQQTEKLMADLAEEERVDADLASAAAGDGQAATLAPSAQPSIAHYNAALWSCVSGYHTLMQSRRDDPDSAALVSPTVVLKSADRIRHQMRTRFAPQHGAQASAAARGADELTVALCAIADAYSNRLDSAWKYVSELERRLGRSLGSCPAREEWHAQKTAVARGEATPDVDAKAFDVYQAARGEFERGQVALYAERAQPIIEAVIQLLNSEAPTTALEEQASLTKQALAELL